MIETVLVFLFGFFTAGFLALLAAPVLWRRAVFLTTRRIEASMPLSINELEAEKDRLRAGHAMAARRLEMNIEALNRKASRQLAEIGRLSNEAADLAQGRADQDEAIARLQQETAGQEAELAEAAKAIGDLSDRLQAAQAELDTRAAAIAQLEEMHEEERISASSRQVELAARETDVRKLEDDLSVLRDQRKEAVSGMRGAVAAHRQTETALKEEQKRNADLKRKLEAQMTVLSDREEKLERREGEIARLRAEIRQASEASLSAQASLRLREAEEERDRLATELADKSLQLRSLMSGGEGGPSPAADSFAAEREKLQTRLSKLLKENKKLRAELSAAGSRQAASGEEAADAGTDARLREQIGTLAAEVLSLTAALEGEGSPIDAALSGAQSASGDEQPASLADRVRALREAAAR
ncbi:hypothetical protein [Nitratireductor sp. ZSWI3]|uniref:hypothetical protein n=1 Tax=Nitratireductor sp. ZSWI3 TaxID=2966359 RepID=UPI00214FE570|nr:hypothetical protein [Nitratireductor sp. ZSWI3]MCR4266619.1 hypothetical protein [Nitratireductor sp. ZSWI3]